MTKQEREEKIASLTLEIQEHQRAIESLTDEINSLKSECVCPKCGEEIAEDALFCANCGTRIIKKTTADSSPDTCPQCGAHTEQGMKFCIKCGYRLDGEETVSEEAAVPEAAVASEETAVAEEIPVSVEAPQVDSAVPKIRLCPICGAEQDDDSVFCFMCGNKIQ